MEQISELPEIPQNTEQLIYRVKPIRLKLNKAYKICNTCKVNKEIKEFYSGKGRCKYCYKSDKYKWSTEEFHRNLDPILYDEKLDLERKNQELEQRLKDAEEIHRISLEEAANKEKAIMDEMKLKLDEAEIAYQEKMKLIEAEIEEKKNNLAKTEEDLKMELSNYKKKTKEKHRESVKSLEDKITAQELELKKVNKIAANLQRDITVERKLRM